MEFFHAPSSGRLSHRRLSRAAAAAALLAGIVLAVMPVAAAGGSTESHCVLQVVGQAASGELSTELVGCSSSFAGAMALASGGTVQLAAETPGAAVFEDAALAETLATFTLGIHFDGYNGTGSSITVVGSGCTGGYWNTPPWFDNLTSSSYNGCYRLVHYDYANLTGFAKATMGAGVTHNLTTFNNRTESVQYFGS